MQYINLLDECFSDLLKRFNKVQLAQNTRNTIAEGNAIFQEGYEIFNMLKSYTAKLEGLLSDCQDFVKDAVIDLTQKSREDDFVFHTKGGMLSYNSRSLVIDENLPIIQHKLKEEKKTKPVEKKEVKPHIERVFVKEMAVNYNAPVVNNITDIPPMFHYFAGNQKYAAGLYCCIQQNIFIKVPFPDVIDSTKDYSKFRSIRCKYKTQEICNLQRFKMSKYHSSDVRLCNFAHQGEKLVKIGYPSRCAIPNFGNPANFPEDHKIIDKDALKTLMLYGISDLIAVALTIDNMNYNNVCCIFDNIN